MIIIDSTIRPLSPFNFDLTAQMFAGGDKRIRTYTNGEFHQILRINNNLVLVDLISIGTIEKPKLSVKLKSANPLTSQDKQKVKEAVRFIFNLNFDLCML